LIKLPNSACSEETGKSSKISAKMAENWKIVKNFSEKWRVTGKSSKISAKNGEKRVKPSKILSKNGGKRVNRQNFQRKWWETGKLLKF
jgi:hypothetical protein